MLSELAPYVRRGGVLALCGAGMSTASGIPDYRGPTGAFARGHQPMTYQEFIGSAEARRRYWARSVIGYQRMAAAQPNAAHYALAELQRSGLVSAIITQNVDGLQDVAGASNVLELHGGRHGTVCVGCGHQDVRSAFHHRLRLANPNFAPSRAGSVNPDGDIDLADGDVAGFRLVGCVECGADPVKPDVVFFGETLPAGRVQRCVELLETASSVLVLGSSLAVMSGYRIVLRAKERSLPVLIVNQGATRADGFATVRIDAPLDVALGDLALPVG